MFKIIKKILLSLAIVVSTLLIIVGGYVIYMSIQYYRIEDVKNITESIQNNQSELVALETEYTISTYNIGFGAYSRDYSFFMDTGETLDGKKLTGKSSRAKSKKAVLNNTNGSISLIEKINPDFMFFQEVDTSSTRSYKVNQLAMIKTAFPNYANIFASNFHSGYLFYPFLEPHGKVNSGIVTLTNKQITESIRYKLPIDESFINKFVDLDRCYLISRLELQQQERELVLINIHMSAYDEGGVYRKKQWELIKAVLTTEVEKGNYVILGGDFNHDIAGSINSFPTQQKIPDWVSIINEEDLPTGYQFATSNLAPTCRSAEIPYEQGVNYTVTVDGFIISDNIDIISVTNINTIDNEDVAFLYSDHNPVVLKFKLKN